MVKQPRPASKKVGRMMVLLAWLIFLAILAVSFQHWHTKDTQPSAVMKPGSNTLVLKSGRNKHYYVKCQVNGHKPVIFMVDTGASVVAMSRQMAKEFGVLKTIRMRVNTANGSTIGHSGMIKHLVVGGAITLDRVQAVILPKLNTPLLGMSALRRLEMIHRGKQLELKPLVS